MSLQGKIEQILTEHGYPFTENEKSLVTTCVQCGKEKHFYVFKDGGYGTCMKCGYQAGPEAIVVVLTGCSFKDAKDILQTGKPIQSGNRLIPNLTPKINKSISNLNEFPLPVNFFPLQPKFEQAWKYVTDRGVMEKIIQRYDLRWSPEQRRVFFPIKIRGKCYGYQGRDVTGNSELPYWSPKGFSKSRVLLGYDQFEADKDYLVMSEGPFDMLKLAALGNTVCTMGKNVSRDQLELIKEFPITKLYLALDPDAFDLFDSIAQTFEPEIEVHIMTPPSDRKDFGACTTEEVLRAFLDAERYTRAGKISSAILNT